MEPIYISLGPNCWGAHHLREKQLRKVSLPLDWQNTDPKYSLKYVNELINTHFKFYTKNLKYDDNEIINIIQNALNHKDKLLKYSSNTKRYISDNYMYENSLKTFENHIQLL